MKIDIDIAQEEDFKMVVQLLAALYTELGEESESVRFLNTDLISRLVDSGSTEIYTAKTADNAIVGVATLTFSQAIYAGGQYASLDEMYVIPKYRATTIGKQLIQKIKARASEKSCKRIDVTAPSEQRWESTFKFYNDCGFVFTGPKLKFPLGK